MATLYLVSTHGGKKVRVKLVGEDGRVLHNTLYGCVDEGLWHGLRWGLKTTRWVERVSIDGREIRRSEVIDRLWDYVDGRDDRGSPFVVRTMEEIISSLST